MDLGNINLGNDEINAGGLNIPLIKGERGLQGIQGVPGTPRRKRRNTEKQDLLIH